VDGEFLLERVSVEVVPAGRDDPGSSTRTVDAVEIVGKYEAAVVVFGYVASVW
jgi:hypothetical protein